MRRWIKVMILILFVLVIVVVAVAGWYLSKAIPIGTGYVAKYLCSNTFISQRDPEVVFEEDIRPVNPLANIIKWETMFAPRGDPRKGQAKPPRYVPGIIDLWRAWKRLGDRRSNV